LTSLKVWACQVQDAQCALGDDANQQDNETHQEKSNHAVLIEKEQKHDAHDADLLPCQNENGIDGVERFGESVFGGGHDGFPCEPCVKREVGTLPAMEKISFSPSRRRGG